MTKVVDRDPLHQLWGGRFTAGLDESVAALNHSLPVDLRLWPYDVRAAKAWVSALGDAGVLDPTEEASLQTGLGSVAERLAGGEGVGAQDEDVHTLVERLLYEEIGPLAGKLNTGRSRNDQVATDLKLWCLETTRAVDLELASLGRTLLAQARVGVDILLPGYTHGQRAQPIRWSFVLLAHAYPLLRDRGRLADAAGRLAELPLGAGALAGSGVVVDRRSLAAALGFEGVTSNSLDTTGARDFVAELIFVLAMVATDVSRLAAELLTYASAEYGFVKLGEGFCTGSSLMPQKRNPDALELVRAKQSRVLGGLMGILSLLRGLPAGYSKDLQEDKALLFDAADTVLATLPAVRGAVETLEVDGDRMAAALDPTLLATDIADELVERGMSFRAAHGVIGELVLAAEAESVSLLAVPVAKALEIHPELPAAIASIGSWEDSIERRSTAGGSSRESVQRQIEELAGAFAS